MKTTMVVLDGYTLNPGDNPWDDLEALGELTVYAHTPPEQVVERARGASILLTNKTRLTAELLAQLPDVAFVGVLATGYDVVDVAAASSRGIVVSNVPGYGDSAVAQHTMALILGLCHRVEGHDSDVRRGVWTRAGHFCFWRSPPRELAGLTLGIVGLGNIGRRVGALGSAFGMSVLAWGGKSHGEPPFAPFAWAQSWEQLLAESDIITLHCPLNARSRGMINAQALRQMKSNAFLINTSRGELIDEHALAQALTQSVIGGAALDVLSTEPVQPGHPLLEAPRCIITPHMAWGSLAARQRLMRITVGNVQAFLNGSPIHTVGG
ncbi:MAG: D-2-hydroxyacid dehydrogenase [Myxococcota bacterium]